MSNLDSLLENYQTLMDTPWRKDAPPMERVWFCVYNEKDELALRAKLEEFELATIKYSKEWLQYNLTDDFALWLSTHPYAEEYFKRPMLIGTVMSGYKAYLVTKITEYIQKRNANQDTVLALYGLGSLYGLLKAKELIEKIAPSVKGRLLAFFPGSYENNNYRLLDGYDGWTYLAIPITADKKP